MDAAQLLPDPEHQCILLRGLREYHNTVGCNMLQRAETTTSSDEEMRNYETALDHGRRDYLLRVPFTKAMGVLQKLRPKGQQTRIMADGLLYDDITALFHMQTCLVKFRRFEEVLLPSIVPALRQNAIFY